jgi:TonB family protein
VASDDVLELQDSDPRPTHNGRGRGEEQYAPHFQLLEKSAAERRRQWASFGAGSATQVVLWAGLVWLTFVLALVNDPGRMRKEIATRLYLPNWTAPQTTPPKVRHSSPIYETKPKLEVKPEPENRIVVPSVVAATRPKLPPRPPDLHPVAPKVPVTHEPVPQWRPKLEVGSFGASTSTVASLKLPSAKVQTGGFGDPNGLPGHAEGGNSGNVPRLGSFELPSGPGLGNGSGGERGARGTVASAGFGNGIAAPGQGQGGPNGGGQVQSAGFADAQSLKQAPRDKPRETSTSYEPVEITIKPNPVYTDEGRRLRIEGEVLIGVVFSASGRLRILGVTQGLGHGLDEAALRAAQQIQFKPARRNGEPVDTTATLRILFQLAN